MVDFCSQRSKRIDHNKIKLFKLTHAISSAVVGLFFLTFWLQQNWCAFCLHLTNTIRWMVNFKIWKSKRMNMSNKVIVNGFWQHDIFSFTFIYYIIQRYCLLFLLNISFSITNCHLSNIEWKIHWMSAKQIEKKVPEYKFMVATASRLITCICHQYSFPTLPLTPHPLNQIWLVCW